MEYTVTFEDYRSERTVVTEVLYIGRSYDVALVTFLANRGNLEHNTRVTFEVSA